MYSLKIESTSIKSKLNTEMLCEAKAERCLKKSFEKSMRAVMKTQESKNCSPSLRKRWNIIKAKHNTVI